MKNKSIDGLIQRIKFQLALILNIRTSRVHVKQKELKQELKPGTSIPRADNPRFFSAKPD